ncbi:DUF2780 domain-containing protein [Enterococcus faecium]|uniref:DUF2780 domain-containing protein n=1 Tax=Enterococcus faecium TaxID=1352 RepID=UPI001C9E1751|nr:DUF2780 domain-containing protein [Enterococcus faecium]
MSGLMIGCNCKFVPSCLFFFNVLGKSGGDSKGLGSLLGNADSMGDVNKAFGTLGMDSGMTEKFAQVLVDYFGKQGANSELLGSLSNLWGVSKAGGSSLL